MDYAAEGYVFSEEDRRTIDKVVVTHMLVAVNALDSIAADNAAVDTVWEAIDAVRELRDRKQT